jgi:hypothetical protein
MTKRDEFESLCKRVASTLASAGVTPKAALATLPEARKRVFGRRYGPDARKPDAVGR